MNEVKEKAQKLNPKDLSNLNDQEIDQMINYANFMI